ncbi:Uncharacterised protein [Mycobacterium tuberculosis]|nr:Uncharacterised protein [Mycobacterium tuberculosis]
MVVGYPKTFASAVKSRRSPSDRASSSSRVALICPVDGGSGLAW